MMYSTDDYIAEKTFDLSLVLNVSFEASNDAVELAKKARKNPHMKGYSNDALILSSLYLSARKPGRTPILLKNVANIADGIGGRTKTGLRNCIRKINRLYNVSKCNITPESLLKRYAEKLNLKDAERESVLSLLSEVDFKSGKPSGWLAGAAYIVINRGRRRITEMQLADMLEVSAVTIRKRIMDLREMEGG